MGLTLAKCPACGANLNLETDTDYFYCPHCGSKVLQQEDRIVIEHVNRTIDEAEVRKVEFEREKYALDEERIEKNRQQNLPKAKKTVLFGLALFVLGQIMGRIEDSMLSVTVWYVGAAIMMVGGAAFTASYFGDVNKSNVSNQGTRDKTK